MLGTSQNAVRFQWFLGQLGRKVGSLKRRVRSHLVRWVMKICTPLLRKARFQVKMLKKWRSRTAFWSWDVKRQPHFQVKMLKKWRSQTSFWSWDVEKLHATVAGSTFSSQNVKNITIPRPLLEVEMSVNCTPLWREAHRQHKMLKTWHARHAQDIFGPSDLEEKMARRCGAKHIYSIYKSNRPQNLTTNGLTMKFFKLEPMTPWQQNTLLSRGSTFNLHTGAIRPTFVRLYIFTKSDDLDLNHSLEDDFTMTHVQSRDSDKLSNFKRAEWIQ